MIFFNDKFKEFRKSLKLSMEELAVKVGVSRRTMWSWEKGKRTPSTEKARLIAKCLNISVNLISDLPKEHPTSENLSKYLNTESSKIDFFNEEHNHDKVFSNIIYNLNNYRNDLKKASSVIKGLLSSMNAIFYIKDINHNYIAANELFISLAGVPRGTAVFGKKDEYFYPKDDAKANFLEDNAVILSGECILNREGYIPGSRKKKWGLISKLPIYDKEKNITGLVATFVDITERRNNETYRRHLEAAINKIDAAVWLGSEIYDNDGIKKLNIDFFNKTAENKYGFSAGKAAKIKNICCGGCLFDKKQSSNIMESNSFPVIHHHYHKNTKNQETILEEKIFKYDESRYIGIINDVTIQQKYNKILELLEINVNSLNDGLAIRDVDSGEYLYLNNGMEAIFGFPLNTFYKNGWNFWLDNCVHKEFKESEIEYNLKKEWPTEIRTIKAVKADGSERWVNINSSLRKYLNKNCLISIFRDCTARKTTDDISNILDKISDTVSICQKDNFKVLYMSKAVKDVFGYPKEQFQGKSIFDALSSCICDEDHEKQINLYKTGNIPEIRKYRIKHPEKGLRIVESRTTEVIYMEKECWFMICRDITENIK